MGYTIMRERTTEQKAAYALTNKRWSKTRAGILSRRRSVAKYSQTQKGRDAHKSVDKKRRRRRTLYHYNLTEDQYNTMLTAQNGVCAACKEPERRLYKRRVRYLSVDHCHETGRIRGLLCYGCNSAFGFLHDKAEYVARLLDYAQQ